MKVFFIASLLVLLIVSCEGLNNRPQEPLAKVHNQYLYREDLSGIIPRGTDPADSARLARSYINKWIRDQLFLRLAEINLPEEEKNLDKQINDFRASLLIHKYQQYLLNQKLDSIVSLREIEQYYEEHSSNFLLERPVIQGIYVKVPLDAPDRNRILSWFRNENGLEQILNYCGQYAVNYAFFDETWMYLDEIRNEIPHGMFNIHDISGRDHISVTDDNYHYFIGITDYRPPRSQMPLSIASRNIKSIILNKRKIQFLNDLEKNVLTEGLSKNLYQYH